MQKKLFAVPARVTPNRHLNQIMLVMRLTSLLLITTFLQVSASGVAQSVSLSGKNLHLKEVFYHIKQQTGYAVFFSDKNLLAASKPVSFSVSGMPLRDFMDTILKDQQLTYQIVDKTISVLPAEVDPPLIALSLPINGRILDINGDPVPGASIRILRSKTGTIADAQGYFSLQQVEEDALVEVSIVGYIPIVMKMKGGKLVLNNTPSESLLVNGNPSSVLIKLAKSTSQLDAVTVSTGYWTTTQRKSTGNISKITSKEIEKQSLSSPLLSLQGRVAGLEVSPQTGAATTAPKIRIRGENSLRRNGGLPLYVVDGMVIDSRPLYSQANMYYSEAQGIDPLLTLGVENIESIEILKDADATAIYGSQGANGVIIITTKKGPSDGSTNFDLSAYQGFGRIAERLDMMDTETFLKMRREAYANAGQVPEDYVFDLTQWDSTRNTDWQKELLGGHTSITDASLSFSGGTRLSAFRFNTTYYRETSFFSRDFANRRFTGNMNYQHRSSNQRFNFSVAASFGSSKNNLASSSYLVSTAINLPPNAPALYNEDGTINWAPIGSGNDLQSTFYNNPAGDLLRTVESNAVSLITNSRVGYELMPGLVASLNLGYTFTNQNEISKNPIASYFNVRAFGNDGSASFTTNDRKGWSIEPELNYRKKIGDHELEILAGANLRDNKNRQLAISASGYSSDAMLHTLKGATDWYYSLDDATHYRYVAAYGRIGYNYKEKYLLNLTARRDGSSRFGPGKQFGNFGAAGFGWIFTNEPSVKDNFRALSYGKLRGSIGVTGNDQIGDYMYQNLYNIHYDNYQGAITLLPQGLFNPDFHWETTQKLELTLSLGFLEDRIMTDVTWYRNRSSNQLVSYQLPTTTGFENVFTNFPATIQNTGWEFRLQTRNIISKDVQWRTSFNLIFPRNKLLAFAGIEGSSYAKQYKVGEPLSIRYQYTWDGVDPQTGLHMTRDINNDGRINSNDRSFGPNLDQRYYGGMLNTVSYRSFELAFLLQFSKRNAMGFYQYYPSESSSNAPMEVLKRWQKPGDITNIGKFTADFNIGNAFSRVAQSNYNIVDGSFIKLKTVSLRYQMPGKWLAKSRFKQAGVFMEGQNLLTITKFMGLDPETGATGVPQLRMITGGIQFKL